MLSRNYIVFLPLMVLAGCSILKKGDNSHDGKDESYTYQYSFNGCSTGKHSFDSKKKYCDGLLDDDLNNYCALETRESSYKLKCGDLPSASGGVKNPNPSSGDADQTDAESRANAREFDFEGIESYQIKTLRLLDFINVAPQEYGLSNRLYNIGIRRGEFVDFDTIGALGGCAFSVMVPKTDTPQNLSSSEILRITGKSSLVGSEKSQLVLNLQKSGSFVVYQLNCLNVWNKSDIEKQVSGVLEIIE